VKAQKAFAPALKTSSNPHFKSRYADLAACIEAVVDALNANGIGLMQKQHPSESGVTVETVFVHESGEVMSAGMLTVPAAKHDPQGYGSALTYARRYSLMAACGIAPEDDDGNSASKPKQPVKAATSPAVLVAHQHPARRTRIAQARAGRSKHGVAASIYVSARLVDRSNFMVLAGYGCRSTCSAS
jgi:hypothetical protein